MARVRAYKADLSVKNGTLQQDCYLFGNVILNRLPATQRLDTQNPARNCILTSLDGKSQVRGLRAT
jgi:hypothetical protein